MKIKLRHNTQMRLLFGAFLIILIPGLLFLLQWPLMGWRLALLLPTAFTP